MPDGQSDIHITIKYVFTFLQILIRRKKKIDVRLNKTLKLTFILMLFDSVYPTRPSDTVTKYTIYPPILLVERLLKWYWVLLCYFIATLLYHQKWSTNPFFSYYLVVATAKMSLDFYFLICKSQDCVINCQWIIQSKLIDCPSDILFNFGIAPALVVLLGWPAGLNASWRYNTFSNFTAK